MELTYAVNEDAVYLAPDTMREFATEILHAQPWPDVDKRLYTKIGFLDVLEPDKTAVRYPLYRF